MNGFSNKLEEKLLTGGKTKDIPRILPFSDLGDPPESFFDAWWKPFGVLFLILVSTGSVAILVVVSPIVIGLTLVRRMAFCCVKYHTPPSKLRVAVIGGGWSGLQCMQRLKELGVKEVKGFERYDALGGTWHPNLRYHTIQIHGAMWITSFSKYPYNPSDRDVNDGKVLGEEAQSYIQRFAKDKGLNGNYVLNSKIRKISYDSPSRTAKLSVEDSGGKLREEGPFDFVIYCSQASEPNIPEMPGRDSFKGKVLHSTQFKKEHFDDIVKNKKKVAVVGGSKAGCDLALCFQRAGYDQFNWVYRTPYLFWKYELMFHNRSIVNALRGFTTVLAVLWTLVSNTVAGWMLWSSGLTVTYGKPHNDWRKFHFGILCPQQRRDLAAIPDAKKVVANPTGYGKEGLLLKDGRVVEADYVLFGTGCESGIDKMTFEKDGAEYLLNPKTKMMDHFIVPDFPVLANSTALWTTFGPVRAVNSGDLAIYHNCVRSKLSEEDMLKRAQSQLAGDTNSTSGWLFQSDTMALRKWLLMHIDLMMAGFVDFFDFLYHALQVFCFSHQDALKFRILPE
eukprot:TRINITY_DN4301_c1_g1_i1.p1 TRINITY_DN4301_c1_g1~~TRINITY_DN4301_c1_g1_i1.p1  ORF type:complete len:562 (+),score=95.74 TRINITY_DN4301_c1_g1_i1:104-1789(+)